MADGFVNRRDAGWRLAQQVLVNGPWHDPIVLALPRGGVPVAAEVARALAAPLDVFLVRKLGVPGHEELAMGAIASGGVRVMNENVVEAAGVSPEQVAAVTAREAAELQRREKAYRDDRPPPQIAGRSVIIVDDGLATGASMRAAVAALRQQSPSRLAIAVPVAARQACDDFAPLVDDVICVLTPEQFAAVGNWYRDFRETTDEEVRSLLDSARPNHRVA